MVKLLSGCYVSFVISCADFFFFYLSVEVSQFTAADTEGNGELTEENGDSFVQINGNR